MYNLQANQIVQARVKAANDALAYIINAPIVRSTDDERQFLAGLKKLKTMSQEEAGRLLNATIEDVVKNLGDSDVKLAIVLMEKKLAGISAVMQGQRNQMVQDLIRVDSQRAFHQETATRMEQAVQSLDELVNGVANGGIDTGWLLAFTQIQALGKDQVEVRDVVGEMQFFELSEDEAPILTSIGKMAKKSFGVRRFGGGIKLNNYSIDKHIFGANDILAGLGLAATTVRSWTAYKEIFMLGDNTKTEERQEYIKDQAASNTDIDKYWIKVQNMRHTINEAHRKMVQEARQMEDSPVSGKRKKGASKNESPLPVTPATRAIVYFNPIHEQFMRHVQGIGQTASNLDVSLLRDFVFISTDMAPISGGLKADPNGELRDEWNTFNPAVEAGSLDSVGAMMVLPGMRNYSVQFQNLAFDRQQDAVSESTTVVAFERYNHKVDERQHRLIKLVPAPKKGN